MVIKGMKLWRCIQDSLSNALPTPDTRVVLIVGPRQSGKTTLAKKMAIKGMAYYTLDNATTLDAARQDPVGFVRGMNRAIIDEIQRTPELLLAPSRKAWIPTSAQGVSS
ncbi:hypothetical protein ELI52_31135 (plasmid) [Rhizobium ruizarguesonis]|nr:hypothetical protein ELI52_31135 [Rhizobium ruizarguesonis]